MLADSVATPVLERLAAGGERQDQVAEVGVRGVPLMPNGIAVERIALRDGAVVRAGPGRLSDGAGSQRRTRASQTTSPALRRPCAAELGGLGRRGAAIVADAGGLGDLALARAARGREGAGHLDRALADRDPAEAERAADRLLGLGGGLTPEGDDVLAAVAAVVATLRGAADDRLVAALIPADARDRTTALSATLLALAAQGRIAEPVHPLLDPAEKPWRGALARLRATGASTGRAYAIGVGAALRALARG